MIIATLCYIRRGRQTLMLHRNKRKDDFHYQKWNGLGGKLLPGESPEDCIRREVLEESGLMLTNIVLKGVIAFPLFDQKNDWLVFIYIAKGFQGELRDSPEGELVWVENDKILQLNLWEGDKVFLPWLEQKEFFSAKFIYQNDKFKEYQVTFY